jgi:hypothetical protein
LAGHEEERRRVHFREVVDLNDAFVPRSFRKFDIRDAGQMLKKVFIAAWQDVPFIVGTLMPFEFEPSEDENVGVIVVQGVMLVVSRLTPGLRGRGRGDTLQAASDEGPPVHSIAPHE